jgi:hypothetical protein
MHHRLVDAAFSECVWQAVGAVVVYLKNVCLKNRWGPGYVSVVGPVV